MLAFRFRQLEQRRSMVSYPIATSVLSFCALIAIGGSLPERNGSGLFQRALLGLSFPRLALVSWRLWGSAKRCKTA